MRDLTPQTPLFLFEASEERTEVVEFLHSLGYSCKKMTDFSNTREKDNGIPVRVSSELVATSAPEHFLREFLASCGVSMYLSVDAFRVISVRSVNSDTSITKGVVTTKPYGLISSDTPFIQDELSGACYVIV